VTGNNPAGEARETPSKGNIKEGGAIGFKKIYQKKCAVEVKKKAKGPQMNKGLVNRTS